MKKLILKTIGTIAMALMSLTTLTSCKENSTTEPEYKQIVQKVNSYDTTPDTERFTKTWTFSRNFKESFTIGVSNLAIEPMASPYVKVHLVLKKRSKTAIPPFFNYELTLNSETEEVCVCGYNSSIEVKAYVFNNGLLRVSIELEDATFRYLDSCTISYQKL